MKIMLINNNIDAVENAMEVLSKIQLNGEVKLKDCDELVETIDYLNELLNELKLKENKWSLFFKQKPSHFL